MKTKEKQTHTPGPWRFDEKQIHGDVMAFDPERSRAVCVAQIHNERTAGTPNEQARANARLIAAAPELLAELKKALEFVVATHGGENDGDIQEDIRAAIQKAEGKS